MEQKTELLNNNMTTEYPNRASEFASILPGRIRSRSAWITLTKRDWFPSGVGNTISSLIYQRSKVPDVRSGVTFDVKFREYNLQQLAIKGPIPTSNPSFEEIRQEYTIIEEYVRWIQENRIRDEYMRLCGNHVSLDKKGFLECTVTGCDHEFPSNVPKFNISQSALNGCYISLVRNDAGGQFDLHDGRKIYGLIASPEAIRRVKSYDSDLSIPISEESPYRDILRKLGINWHFCGFCHIADYQAPRFALKGWPWNRKLERIPYYQTDKNMDGSYTRVNQKYLDAPYEVAFVFNPEVQTVRVAKSLEPNDPRNPEDAFGNFQIVSDGSILVSMLQGSQPVRTEWGYAIMFLRLNRKQRFWNWVLAAKRNILQVIGIKSK